MPRASLRSLKQVIVEKNGKAAQSDPVFVYHPRLQSYITTKDSEGLFTVAESIKSKLQGALQLPEGAMVRTGEMKKGVSFEEWANQHVHAPVQEGSSSDAFELVDATVRLTRVACASLWTSPKHRGRQNLRQTASRHC